MPIKIDSDLPARKTLEEENIFVMTDKRAATQDIRPLKIAIVNLMPTKEATETQLLRLLGNTPLQVEISLVRMEGHVSKHTGIDHLERFYISSRDVFNRKFDGMIITGAPVEQLPYEQVDYWDELCRIMDYAKKNVFCTLYICWGAQAGLYHLYGIEKKLLDKKLSGIYLSKNLKPKEPLVRGFDDSFPVPTSRYTTIDAGTIKANKNLVLLADSEVTGMARVIRHVVSEGILNISDICKNAGDRVFLCRSRLLDAYPSVLNVRKRYCAIKGEHNAGD